MAGVNPRLKRTFIVFNIFFTLAGVVTIGSTVISQVIMNEKLEGKMEDRATALICICVLSLITMAFAILGACGAYKESQRCLIAFLVCMFLGMVLMLLATIMGAMERLQLEAKMTENLSQIFPLDFVGGKGRLIVNSMQTEFHCCGIFSYEDWKDMIPDSCDCKDMKEEYECKEVNYSDYFQMKTKTIYTKPCFPIVKKKLALEADIFILICFSLAVLALLGVILSSIMIFQIFDPKKPSTLLLALAFLTLEPSKYQKLHKPPLPC